MPTISARRLSLLIGLSVVIPVLHVLAPASALASRNQVSLFEEDSAVGSAGAASQVLQELRHLGSTDIRVAVHWTDLAPSPNSSRRPKFNASDPNAYAASKWAPYDNAVNQAQRFGVKVLMTVTGHAPKWAFGPGEPPDPHGLLGAWKPSASEYGKFFTALAKRYRTVHSWEIYNEPNFGESLSPQSVGPVYTSAVMYRGLVSSAWKALKANGHGRDTILIGSLAAHGQNTPRVFGETPPVLFVRELYCLDRNYRPLRGGAARTHSCPASTSTFRRLNPGLFNSSGFAIHPYPLGPDMTLPPTRTRLHNPNYAGFSQLPSFTRALDRALRADGSGKRFPLWNTEYGYISNPPNSNGVSLANQATYLDWAEYLSWKNPRVASFMQYLLIDATNDAPPNPECGGFSSGLLFYPGPTTTSPCKSNVGPPGSPKPALDAWRLPLFMPQASGRKGGSLEVWGCVRPAAYAFQDTHRPQTAQVQFKANGSSAFKNLATVTFRGGSCYFDRRIAFPSSGTVRLSYNYPAADPRLRPTFAVSRYFDPLAPFVSRSVAVRIG